MDFETFLKGLDFLIPLERVSENTKEETLTLTAEPFFTGVSSFCCVVAPGTTGSKRLGFRPTRQRTVRKLRRGRSRTKVEKDQDGIERSKALELTQVRAFSSPNLL